MKSTKSSGLMQMARCKKLSFHRLLAMKRLKIKWRSRNTLPGQIRNFYTCLSRRYRSAKKNKTQELSRSKATSLPSSISCSQTFRTATLSRATIVHKKLKKNISHNPTQVRCSLIRRSHPTLFSLPPKSPLSNMKVQRLGAWKKH